MSTLGTRCAICLERRCQLEKMSFFAPDLVQQEAEHEGKKKNTSRRERAGHFGGSLRGGSQGLLGDCNRTAARPTPSPLPAPGTAPRLAAEPSNEGGWVSSTPWGSSPGPPSRASPPSPARGSGWHPLPCVFSPDSARFQTPQKFFWAPLWLRDLLNC